MDGVETTGIIRKLGGKHEKLPIIALTANAIQGAKEMFLSRGFNGFISKPIEIQEMNEVLREWLPPGKIEEKIQPARNAERQDDETSGDFVSALERIDEINTEIGLRHVSGMKNMYRETLGLFQKKLAAECDGMSASLNAKDIKSFAIQVHAMKSALSTIGAMNLSDAALKLETAAKSDDIGYCKERFPAFREKLISLHERLSAIFPGGKAIGKRKPGDPAYLKENIKKALAAADNFNGDLGYKIINDLLAYDFGDQNNTLMENAAAAFENFDYNAARESLNKVLA